MPELIGHLITKYLRRHPFEGVSFLFVSLRGHKNAPFSGGNSHLTLHVQEKALFSGRYHQFHHSVHKNALFRGQSCILPLLVHQNALLRPQKTAFVQPIGDLFPMDRQYSLTPQDFWQTGLQYEQRKLRTRISQADGTIQP